MIEKKGQGLNPWKIGQTRKKGATACRRPDGLPESSSWPWTMRTPGLRASRNYETRRKWERALPRDRSHGSKVVPCMATHVPFGEVKWNLVGPSSPGRGGRSHMAMGQKPNRTPSEHPNPTPKIGSKTGGVNDLSQLPWPLFAVFRPLFRELCAEPFFISREVRKVSEIVRGRSTSGEDLPEGKGGQGHPPRNLFLFLGEL